MTRDETIAFNAGVEAVLELSLRCASAIEPLVVTKPTRLNFAHGALLALAEEGRALLRHLGPDGPPFVLVPTPPPRPHQSSSDDRAARSSAVATNGFDHGAHNLRTN